MLKKGLVCLVASVVCFGLVVGLLPQAAPAQVQIQQRDRDQVNFQDKKQSQDQLRSADCQQAVNPLATQSQLRTQDQLKTQDRLKTQTQLKTQQQLRLDTPVGTARRGK
jgi:hypothetical protein